MLITKYQLLYKKAEVENNENRKSFCEFLTFAEMCVVDKRILRRQIELFYQIECDNIEFHGHFKFFQTKTNKNET